MPSHLVEQILTPQDKRYRRCMGVRFCCHIRTCVFVVGILELLALAVAVVTLFVLYELTAEEFVNRNYNRNHHQKSTAVAAAGLSNHNRRLQHDGGERLSDDDEEEGIVANFTSPSINYMENHTTKSVRIKSRVTEDVSSSDSSSEERARLGLAGNESDESSDDNSSDDSSEEAIEKEKDLIYLRAKHRYYVRSMVGAAGTFVVGVFVVALMFTGLVKRRSQLLLPHLGVQILAMLGLVIVIILYAVWCTSNAEEPPEAKRHLYPINRAISCWLIIGSCTIAFVLEMFSFAAVLTCYRYLRDSAIDWELHMVTHSDGVNQKFLAGPYHYPYNDHHQQEKGGGKEGAVYGVRSSAVKL